MAHVELVSRPRGLLGRMAFRMSRRRVGAVAEPVAAAAHHGGVLAAVGALEGVAQVGWRRIDPQLRGLVLQLSAARIGCSWCVDFGYYEQVSAGADPAKVRAVVDWRTSSCFDDRERAALEYTEAATATPVTVPAELAERLHRHFDDAELVELAAWVAIENLRSRFNGGLGLRSQGFSDRCEVPVATAPPASALGASA